MRDKGVGLRDRQPLLLLCLTMSDLDQVLASYPHADARRMGLRSGLGLPAELLQSRGAPTCLSCPAGGISLFLPTLGKKGIKDNHLRATCIPLASWDRSR